MFYSHRNICLRPLLCDLITGLQHLFRPITVCQQPTVQQGEDRHYNYENESKECIYHMGITWPVPFFHAKSHARTQTRNHQASRCSLVLLLKNTETPIIENLVPCLQLALHPALMLAASISRQHTP